MHRILVSVTIIVIGFFIVNSFGADGEISKPNHTDCRKIMMIIAKKQVKAFGECSREMKEQIPDPEEYQKRIQCVVKCSMLKEKLIDETLQINNETVVGFLNDYVPKIYHEIGHMFIDNCMAQFEGKFDPKDEFCISYGEFVKCMQNNLGDIC